MEDEILHDDDTIVHDQEENVALSSDEAAEPIEPSPRKSRKGAQKRVTSVKINGGDGSPRSKGEVYPPSDSWSWRKYGQKPIKGSPYPRGYYRCSSSKGCPARKQVERSCLDPTTVVITYSHEHNHSLPKTTNKHHHHRASSNAAAATSPTATSTEATDVSPAEYPQEEFAVFMNHPDLEPDNSGFSDLTAELGWFSDVGSTTMIQSSMVVGPKWADADFAVMLPIGEEDQSLFGDLGELPEYSLVFRHHRSAETPCYGGTG